MPEQEVSLDQAKAMTSSGQHKLVWIGSEPLDYVASLIRFDVNRMMQLSPREIRTASASELERMSGMVFMCYHGVTSMSVVILLEKRGVKAYSLRGGITAIVGEIF